MTDKTELARLGVTVKPLEWRRRGNLWHAVDPMTGENLYSFAQRGCDETQADYDARDAILGAGRKKGE